MPSGGRSRRVVGRAAAIVALTTVAWCAGATPSVATTSPRTTLAQRSLSTAEHGLPAPLIVGGAPAESGSWPWLAFIHDNLGGGSYESCTGTVVASNLILTAAHCAEDVTTGVLDDASGFTVSTGCLDRSESAACQVSNVTELVPHVTLPETTPLGGINVIGDAALLVLATPTTAPAITLADSNDLALIEPRTGADIAGWGLTDKSDQSSQPTELQDASTVIQDTAYCEANSVYFNPFAQLCTVDAPFDDTSICNGDSGGPLVVDDGGTWVEVGVTSTSENSCDPTRPDVFTRVDYVESWVQSWIVALTPAPNPQPSSTSAPTPTVPTVTTPSQNGTSPPNEPGLYTGLSNQHRHVSVRIAPDGAEVTALHAGLHMTCSDRYYFNFTDAWFGSANSLSIGANHVAQRTLLLPASRYWAAGHATITLAVTSSGGIVGEIFGAWASRTPAAGVCRTGTITFTLTRH